MTPRYGYTVCRGVPNTNTVPVPVGTRDPITAGIPVPVPNPIQLPSGYAWMTCALELNIFGTINVAMLISLVGLSQVWYSSGLWQTATHHIPMLQDHGDFTGKL